MKISKELLEEIVKDEIYEMFNPFKKKKKPLSPEDRAALAITKQFQQKRPEVAATAQKTTHDPRYARAFKHDLKRNLEEEDINKQAKLDVAEELVTNLQKAYNEGNLESVLETAKQIVAVAGSEEG
jgi:hypothetical protein